MKYKTILKLLIDIAMFVVYLMLMFAEGAGCFFHEAAGIGIGVLFIIHIILNLSMTKGLVSSIMKRSGNRSRKLLFLSDLILFIGMPIVILTGVLIAKKLFVLNIELPWQVLFSLHKVSSYICLAAICLHISMHAKYLVGVLKKIPSMEKKELWSAFYRFGAGATIAVILYFSMSLLISNGNNRKMHISTPHRDSSQADTVTRPKKSETTNNVTETGTSFSESISSDSENEKESEQPTSEVISEVIPTLEEYLENLHCTGCRKQCSLLKPKCRKGQAQAEEAIEEYYRIYNLEKQ